MTQEREKPPSERRHRRRPVTQANPDATVTPDKRTAQRAVATAVPSIRSLDGDDLDAAILTFIRRHPNRTVDLAPLAAELDADPYRVQLAVEDLHRRRMVVAPFIEPGAAHGATLTESGLRWLLAREGGRPSETPAALKPATEMVRPSDEAARLPRAAVYGVARK
jgi:hypothetical protein